MTSHDPTSDCPDTLFDQALLGALSAEDQKRLDDYLQNCAACRTRYAETQSFVNEINPKVRQRALRRFKRAKRSAERSVNWRPVAFALAAALAVIGLFLLQTFRTPASSETIRWGANLQGENAEFAGPSNPRTEHLRFSDTNQVQLTLTSDRPSSDTFSIHLCIFDVREPTCVPRTLMPQKLDNSRGGWFILRIEDSAKNLLGPRPGRKVLFFAATREGASPPAPPQSPSDRPDTWVRYDKEFQYDPAPTDPSG